jgi:hypothetical protein
MLSSKACFKTYNGIAQVFPIEVRGAGNAIATAVNWTSNLACSVTFLPLIHALSPPGPTNPWPAFALYAGANAVGLGLLYVLMPETKGLSSDAIAQMFRAGWIQTRRRQGYTPIS